MNGEIKINTPLRQEGCLGKPSNMYSFENPVTWVVLKKPGLSYDAFVSLRIGEHGFLHTLSFFQSCN
jgi:hypothetical protein